MRRSSFNFHQIAGACSRPAARKYDKISANKRRVFTTVLARQVAGLPPARCFVRRCTDSVCYDVFDIFFHLTMWWINMNPRRMRLYFKWLDVQYDAGDSSLDWCPPVVVRQRETLVRVKNTTLHLYPAKNCLGDALTQDKQAALHLYPTKKHHYEALTQDKQAALHLYPPKDTNMMHLHRKNKQHCTYTQR